MGFLEMATKKRVRSKNFKKKGITFKTIILSSFLFAILGFLGIAVFVGQVNVQISDYNYDKIQQNEALKTELENLEINQQQRVENKSLFVKENSGLELVIMDRNKSYSIFTSKNNNAESITTQKLGTLKQKVELYKAMKQKGYATGVSFNFAFPNIKFQLDNLISKTETTQKDATVKFKPNDEKMFEISPHQNEVRVNGELLYSRVIDALRLSVINNKNKMEIELPITETIPSLTTEILQKAQEKRAEFSTSFAGGQEGRAHNIKHALSLLNGSVIYPNQNFSFNDRTSPHSENNGYSKAKIIVNGEFVEGVGGGICQVSTTLYNTALLSDLQILKAQNHSLPVGYVKLPFDAMVSASSDMVFKNTTSAPIYIKAFTQNTDAIIQIYGLPLEEGLEIRRKSVLVETLLTDEKIIKKDEEKKFTDKIDENGGEYCLKGAVEGYVYEGYLQYYKNNQLLKQVLVRKSKYLPQKQIVYVHANACKPQNLKIT